MLAKRIIPCLDIKEGRVVKGTSFVDLRDAGNPLELALRYNNQSADELIFLDITASKEKRRTTIDLATRLARELFIPFTIGGGVNSLKEIHALVNAGADKVTINTAAISNPNLITEGAKHFGSQCIVVAIDARKSKISSKNNQNTNYKAKWEVFSHGGSKATGIDAVDWAIEVESRGAGEILLTSMDNDGHQDGFELELTASVSGVLKIPVIASDLSGVREYLTDYVDSLLFIPEDPANLREKILFFNDSANIQNKLRKGILDTAKKFSWKNVSINIENIITDD